jgi:hypothetical protein
MQKDLPTVPVMVKKGCIPGVDTLVHCNI